MGDLIPERKGLEVFMPHEDKSKRIWDIRDAATCEIIQQSSATGSDNGRGVADDILASSPGAEMWSSSDSDLHSCASAASLGGKPSKTNFLIYWDGDELRELEDGTAIDKGDGTRLLTCNECMSNNYTKATPALTADLLGDWREEIVWRTPDSSALRVYTTTIPTTRRIYTLMHDPQYRMQVSAEQTAYNQPPHPGFHLGMNMPAPRPQTSTSASPPAAPPRGRSCNLAIRIGGSPPTRSRIVNDGARPPKRELQDCRTVPIWLCAIWLCYLASPRG